MTDFSQNSCRICQQIFCCISCRCKHEEKSHNVSDNCNICEYGRTFLKEPSAKLLAHWKAKHWPLHCVICKAVFTTKRDLNIHKKCSSAMNFHENSSMMLTSISDINYDSPPITALLCDGNKFEFSKNTKVTTSTPMQKLPNESQAIMDDISTGTLSVEHFKLTEEFDNIVSIASAKSLKEDTKNTDFSKRRVTFCETPIISYEKIMSSNATGDKCEQFVTAATSLTEDTLDDSQDLKNNPNSLQNNCLKLLEATSDYNSVGCKTENLSPNVIDQIKLDILTETQGETELENNVKPKLQSNFKGYTLEYRQCASYTVEHSVTYNEFQHNFKPSSKKAQQDIHLGTPKLEMDTSADVFSTPTVDANMFNNTSPPYIFKFGETVNYVMNTNYTTLITHNTAKTNESEHLSSFQEVKSEPVLGKQSVWLSMANMVTNAVRKFSDAALVFSNYQSSHKNQNAGNETTKKGNNETTKRNSLKRSMPETIEDETPTTKRIKFSDIKCRRNIRHLGYYLHKKGIKHANKSTQTQMLDIVL